VSASARRILQCGVTSVNVSVYYVFKFHYEIFVPPNCINSLNKRSDLTSWELICPSVLLYLIFHDYGNSLAALNALLLRLIVQQPMSSKFRDWMYCRQTSNIRPGLLPRVVSRIILLPLRYFDMVRPASLLAATVLDCASWDVSVGSLAAPKNEQRLNIEFCVKLGKSATGTYNLIKQVYGDESLSRARVFQWHRRFRERPSSAMHTPKNIERVRDLLQQNCQITVRMFSELLYISKTASHEILHVDPGSPAVLIRFSCALFSFVLLQLDVCRMRFSNCKQLIVCGSEWNFGTSPLLSAATLHSTGRSTTYGHYCRRWFRGSWWSKSS